MSLYAAFSVVKADRKVNTFTSVGYYRSFHN